jgi:hypothetical protein
MRALLDRGCTFRTLPLGLEVLTCLEVACLWVRWLRLFKLNHLELSLHVHDLLLKRLDLLISVLYGDRQLDIFSDHLLVPLVYLVPILSFDLQFGLSILEDLDNSSFIQDDLVLPLVFS